MNRKNFIHQCGAVCVGTTLFASMLQACSTQKSIAATFSNNQLFLPLTSFYIEKNGEQKWKRSVMIKHEKVDFPIVIFRYKENEYKALLLQCTHQGSELNLYGDLISCSAHGSEFGNQGEVLQGPAEASLKSFPVTADAQNIYIKLS